MTGRGTPPADVVVVGSVNRDYVCRVGDLPGPGQTVLGGEASVGSGGKGGNQAVASALLGAGTALVACVGEDDDGRALLADLRAAGVDTTHVALSDARTGLAFVLVDAAGENAIVVAPGANDRVHADQVSDAVAALVGPSSVVVTQAEIPPAAMEAALRTAVAGGCRAVLNLAPYRAVPPGLLALCDPLVVNESEAEGLVGRAVRGLDQARDAAAELGARTRSVVVTVGAEGAVVADAEGVQHVPADVVDVVDTTGAGDAFTGALAAALSTGRPLLEATRDGVRAGSYAVGRPGAQASFASTDQLH